MKLKDIRILHLTNTLGIGGVEKIVYELCDGTKDLFELCIVASTGGVYADKISELGIKHITLPDISSKNPKDILNIIKIIKRIVAENDINIIHCHHRMTVFFAKLISKDIRIIYNNHTIYSDKRFFSHWVLRNVDIIADGVQAKKNVIDFFGIKGKEITVINNAVDYYDGELNVIEEISQARKNGKFIVMDCARLHPQKGMEYFVDSANILLKKGKNIQFYIVGDGELRSQLENRVKRYGIKDSVIFLGFRNDIKSTISQCDVLVLTSIYEGLPLTPMEAFSVKKPVIGTDIDGTREVIKNGVNGLLANSKDSASIASKIEMLYKDRKLLAKLSSDAYISFEEEFSVNRLVKEYKSFYEKL